MKKIKSDNKGFSLIELIIVIAIMAVLVAIIAPNLTKYLSSSKDKTDNKNKDEIKAVIQTAITDFETENGDLMADPGDAVVIGYQSDTIPFQITSGHTNVSDQTKFLAAVNTAMNGDGDKLESKKEKGKHFGATITKQSDGTYQIVVSLQS